MRSSSTEMKDEMKRIGCFSPREYKLLAVVGQGGCLLINGDEGRGEGRLLRDVVVQESTGVLEVLADENKALLVREGAFFWCILHQRRRRTR